MSGRKCLNPVKIPRTASNTSATYRIISDSVFELPPYLAYLMSLVLIIVLPFLGSIIAAFLPSNARNIEAWLAGIIALVCAGLSAAQFSTIFDGEVVRTVLPWLPAHGVDISFRMDGFAWLFAMI
ncbi:MAG: hypothetical protein WCX93_10945, partial [Burkholderiaceae bacterium]